MPLPQQGGAHSADAGQEHEKHGEEAVPGTRKSSWGAKAQQLAQYQTQVEARDVYQVPLRDVVS